jgi:hypothetical protein
VSETADHHRSDVLGHRGQLLAASPLQGMVEAAW